MRAAINQGEDVNNTVGGNTGLMNDKTGLMLAMMEKHNSVVKLLLEQPRLDLNCTDGNGRTALHFAAMFDNVQGVRLLLADPRLNTHNHKDTKGLTPVMAAMCFSMKNALRVLVAHPSVDLHTRDNQGRSLEYCARWVLIIILRGGFTNFN